MKKKNFRVNYLWAKLDDLRNKNLINQEDMNTFMLLAYEYSERNKPQETFWAKLRRKLCGKPS